MNETSDFASVPNASFFLKKQVRDLDHLLFKYFSKYLCFPNPES